MLPKVLAWTSLGLALLFIALALPAVFAWEALGGDTEERLQMARMLFHFGALPALGVSLLLACVLLGMAAFQSHE